MIPKIPSGSEISSVWVWYQEVISPANPYDNGNPRCPNHPKNMFPCAALILKLTNSYYE